MGSFVVCVGSARWPPTSGRPTRRIAAERSCCSSIRVGSPLTDSTHPLVGAVLTGGASRRMGRTKALIDIDGVPMAGRVAAALRGAGCISVVAYGGSPVELDTLGMPILPDRYPGTGPLGGVLGVLELFAASDFDVGGVFVTACDLPALTTHGPRRHRRRGACASGRRRRRRANVGDRADMCALEPACARTGAPVFRRGRASTPRRDRAAHVGRCRRRSGGAAQHQHPRRPRSIPLSS